jgi:poly-gamma-glutamate capsule biosynthesis protein CapA/YwtB (metallophosphatase superfamily)
VGQAEKDLKFLSRRWNRYWKARHLSAPNNGVGTYLNLKRNITMVSQVNAPGTGLTGFANDITNTIGQGAQGINQGKAGIDDQAALVSGTGSTEAVKAQRAASEMSDKNQAALIGLQAQETARKQQMDVLNAIQSGREDSANKKVSATAQNAKGISY